MSVLLVQNATVLTPGRVVDPGRILCRGHLIESVVSFRRADGAESQPAHAWNAPDEPTQVLDARGLMAVPGLIDLQLNGGFGIDFTNDPAGLWKVAAQLPQFGVTSFLPTLVSPSLETIQKAQAVWQAGPPKDFLGATPLGWHLEGPYLNPRKRGAHPKTALRQPAVNEVHGWSPAGGIRMVTLAPELPGALEVIATLRERGVVVAAGHSLCDWDTAQAAFAAGVTYGTHLFNGMGPLDHHGPGLAGAVLDGGPAVRAGLIADGHHVHDALVRTAFKTLRPGRLTLVTDGMAGMGMPPGTYQLADATVTVAPSASQNPAAGPSARLAEGVLAGSVLTLDEAVRRLQSVTQCAIAEAVACASLHPAQVLGLGHERGALRQGRCADLVLVTPDFRVQATVVAGAVAYQNDTAKTAGDTAATSNQPGESKA